jgi:hypothetical protein
MLKERVTDDPNIPAALEDPTRPKPSIKGMKALVGGWPLYSNYQCVIGYTGFFHALPHRCCLWVLSRNFGKGGLKAEGWQSAWAPVGPRRDHAFDSIDARSYPSASRTGGGRLASLTPKRSGCGRRKYAKNGAGPILIATADETHRSVSESPGDGEGEFHSWIQADL